MVNSYGDRSERSAAAHNEKIKRDEHNNNVRALFEKEVLIDEVVEDSVESRYEDIEAVCGNLLFWMRNSSWSFCSDCNALYPQVMKHHFAKRPVTKNVSRCVCKHDRYVVPRFSDIPEEVKSLSKADTVVLRPFDIHVGRYERRQHGYRVKTDSFRLSASKKSVIEKINAVEDCVRRERLMRCYEFLMSSVTSSYRHFVNVRERVVNDGLPFHFFNFKQTEGIECALWPSLYPFTTWCESVISGAEDRRSGKVSFMTKVCCEIVDYSLDFDLLQFHYDRWMFKTVTGAINSSRTSLCSAAAALDQKTFSAGYWQWHHRKLIDAVEQFGLPDVFITLSPYEWTFPFPKWMESLREDTGFSETHLAGLETLHMAHVLSQIVRGYLCGSNDKQWSEHVFNYKGRKDFKNVKTYFYRFEFQGRCTLHLHLLVWLKNLRYCQHSLVNAHIPKDNVDMAFNVYRYQRSDHSSIALSDEPSFFETIDGRECLRLYHPAEAIACGLRGYISTLLPTLKCSMDFQLTDGRAMILNYVSSYVSKWQDSFDSEGLYSVHVSAFQAAYRHVKDFHPGEPDMWLSLSSVKPAWTSSNQKTFTAPTSQTVEKSVVVSKYMRRPSSMESMSLLQWLRAVDHKPSVPKRYRVGSTTLVGVKYLSLFNDEFFFQQMLMNVPHREVKELFHAQHDDLPDCMRFFVSCQCVMHAVWGSSEVVQSHLMNLGNRRHYVANVVRHLQSLRDVYHLWSVKKVTSEQLNRSGITCDRKFTLDPHQLGVVSHVEQCLTERQRCYEDMNREVSDAWEEEDNVSVCCDDVDASSAMQSEDIPVNVRSNDVDWKMLIVVQGKAGTGKTHVLLACISHCIEHGQSVLVATPTGHLSCSYQMQFMSSIHSDTIHAAFHIPVTEGDSPAINWHLSKYDIIVLDEIAMIPPNIFAHIVKTINLLPVRPVLLLSGDSVQLQPIQTIDGKVKQTTNVFVDGSLKNIAVIFRLYNQHRCVDRHHQHFQNCVRYWMPSQPYLNEVQENLVVTWETEPRSADIAAVLREHPNATFVTVSRKGSAYVNRVLLQDIFKDDKAIATLTCDDVDGNVDVFIGMRVMFTQNRDKVHGLVNGQVGIVRMMHNNTILCEIGNDKVVFCHPVSVLDGEERCFTVYPFMPGYSVTICKAQGQTMEHVVVWFDVDSVPRGSGYVAISRVKRMCDLQFLCPAKSCHFLPVFSH